MQYTDTIPEKLYLTDNTSLIKIYPVEFFIMANLSFSGSRHYIICSHNFITNQRRMICYIVNFFSKKHLNDSASLIDINSIDSFKKANMS